MFACNATISGSFATACATSLSILPAAWDNRSASCVAACASLSSAAFVTTFVSASAAALSSFARTCCFIDATCCFTFLNFALLEARVAPPGNLSVAAATLSAPAANLALAFAAVPFSADAAVCKPNFSAAFSPAEVAASLVVFSMSCNFCLKSLIDSVNVLLFILVSLNS